MLAVVRLSHKANPACVAIEADRQHRSDSGESDARNALDLADDFASEGKALFRLTIMKRGRGHGDGGQMIRPKAQLDVQQSIKTLAQESCADEQHDSGGEFDNH